MKNIANIREEFNKGQITKDLLNENPLEQFELWLKEAIESECLHPTALNLATVDSQNRPNSRVVLLKDVTDKGFVFFTNYQSQKGNELASNNYASINFFWGELERQVRINGKVEKVSDRDSIEYFQSRPRESRLGALASPQSQVVADDNALIETFETLKKKYKGQIVPRPSHWGGYVVRPDQIEFWQGRANRMHDRFRYTLNANTWLIQRLAP